MVLRSDRVQKPHRKFGGDRAARAENGRDLVERSHETKPDLVITEIKMPELDGLEAARQIYLDNALPIVVISAYHDDGFVQRAVENHIMAFLVKPIRESHLAPAIVVAMRRYSGVRRGAERSRKQQAGLGRSQEDRDRQGSLDEACRAGRTRSVSTSAKRGKPAQQTAGRVRGHNHRNHRCPQPRPLT